MVHQIRLREPWNSEKMPGGVRYTRHFNAPSGLSQDSQVDLVVKSVSRRLAVVFNGQSLGSLGGPQARTSFDIRSLLQLHNQIWIEVKGAFEDTDGTGLEEDSRPFEVCLELRGE